MKISVASILLVSLSGSEAFAPARPFGTHAAPSTTARSFGVDPSVFHDLPQHVDSLRDAFSSLTLSDVDVDAVTSAAQAAVTSATPDAADTAAAASSSNGWFGFLEAPIEALLYLIHDALGAVGLTQNTWGISIVAMTVIIKLITFPLTKTQLESTNKMQALQPQLKELQAKYQSNPEVQNQKISELYQQNDVNPLAGCLPSFAQIPIFIGLYRAVLTLAKENKLDEPFLWLPNLEGPTYAADPAHGSDWILKGWTDGVPSLGWDDTIAFLALPVFLVLSQFVSMKLMQPKTDDAQSQNPILNFLPLLIGWFSLNVPAALGIYWVVNNIITTASTLVVRNSMKMEPVMPASSSGTTTTESPPSVFTPPPAREKPAGFASSTPSVGSDDITPITPIDVEVVAKDVSTEEGEYEEVDVVEEGTGMSSSSGTKKKRGKKRKKRRN